MNRYIFLDIDGVLNTERHAKYQVEQLGISWTIDQYFDPISMRLLAEIVNKTNAYLIISSTWRTNSYYWTRKKKYGYVSLTLSEEESAVRQREISIESHRRDMWESILRNLDIYGIAGRIIGVTPWFSWKDNIIPKGYNGSPPRGTEIKFWLEEFGQFPYTFAIIDDDADMHTLIPWLCKCDYRTGIIDNVKDQALNLLLNDPNPPIDVKYIHSDIAHLINSDAFKLKIGEK